MVIQQISKLVKLTHTHSGCSSMGDGVSTRATWPTISSRLSVVRLRAAGAKRKENISPGSGNDILIALSALSK